MHCAPWGHSQSERISRAFLGSQLVDLGDLVAAPADPASHGVDILVERTVVIEKFDDDTF